MPELLNFLLHSNSACAGKGSEVTDTDGKGGGRKRKKGKGKGAKGASNTAAHPARAEPATLCSQHLSKYLLYLMTHLWPR